MSEDRLLRTWRVAEILGVSPRRVQQIIAAKGLPVSKRTPGGYALIRESDVRAYVAAHARSEEREECAV